MEDYTVFETALKEYGLPFEKGERLSNHTTVWLGGSADYFIKPKRVVDYIRAVELTKTFGIRRFIIGNGSNLLVSDAGFRGAVICTRALDEIYIERETEKEVFVRAFCGVNLATLSAFFTLHSLTGAEFLSGIPGTVGGAINMNAGFLDKSVSDITLSVFASVGGRLQLLSKNECLFGYRESLFQKSDSFVISALFRAKKADFSKIKENLRAFSAIRKNQPKGKSMGSVFKNGTIPSGKAIEASGLKNARVGGAFVSAEHANFIINDGTASSQDVFDLINTVKAVVKEKTGISLKEEIKYLGEFR